MAETAFNPPLVRPTECHHYDTECQCASMTVSDVTLRDLFAGMAMAGFIAGNVPLGYPNLDVDAGHAYRAADALLRARSKESR